MLQIVKSFGKTFVDEKKKLMFYLAIYTNCSTFAFGFFLAGIIIGVYVSVLVAEIAQLVEQRIRNA